MFFLDKFLQGLKPHFEDDIIDRYFLQKYEIINFKIKLLLYANDFINICIDFKR